MIVVKRVMVWRTMQLRVIDSPTSSWCSFTPFTDCFCSVTCICQHNPCWQSLCECACRSPSATCSLVYLSHVQKHSFPQAANDMRQLVSPLDFVRGNLMSFPCPSEMDHRLLVILSEPRVSQLGPPWHNSKQRQAISQLFTCSLFPHLRFQSSFSKWQATGETFNR